MNEIETQLNYKKLRMGHSYFCAFRTIVVAGF